MKSDENRILAAILGAILDFRHIGFSDVIDFGKFGFPDPENLEKDILQAMFYQQLASWVRKTDFSRHFGGHLGKWP